MARCLSLSPVAVLALGAVLGAASDVLELGDSDFDSTASQHGTMLVEFFAPWCGHCQKLAPEYEAAATRLRGVVALAKVDCTANSETCARFGVNGYPTLKIFRNGDDSSAYDGPRSADGIVSHMKQQAGPSSVELKTVEDLDRLIHSFDASVVGFFSDAGSAQLAEFLKAAAVLRDSYRFAHTSTPELLHRNQIQGEAVVLFRPPHLNSKFEDSSVRYTEAISTRSLRRFIKENIFGMCPHLTNENKEQLMGRDLLTVFFDVDYLRNPKGSNYWRNRVMKVASRFVSEGLSLSYAIADRSDFSYELSEFGLGAVEGELPVVTLRTAGGEKYAMQEEFTRDGKALERFLEDYFARKLKRYMKSEPVPENNDGPVKVVVAETFDEIVHDDSKDVLIEFYAPWCGHCKNLEPKYHELGEKLANDPNIVIAKMDATANDVPPNYDVQGFPVLYFVPKGSKESPKRYEGGREVSDFISYLKREATSTPVLTPGKEDL
ncbi:protein disulfide-isomerase A3-like [Acipenser oxyrinchus oxyrinchus]|uniref:Protein disulfide-isomerase n=1 Tax=Acipenser oxyrinchus oxyrinchus TaxID=40147 RepID=A0AAD8CK74_ACIOX|nr:protein disulfide-isomerase A3-like [Acipenser oxyrinchus oxyrinchus]